MNELMLEVQPILINLLATILTAGACYLGNKVKNFIDEKANTEAKKRVVDTTCRYVEQLYRDLGAKEKLERAKADIIEQLNEKGIPITELELNVLIEATVNGFTHSDK